jgi:hypothetical protein
MVKTKNKIDDNIFYIASVWNENVMIKKFNVEFIKYMKKSFNEQDKAIIKNNSLLSETCRNYAKITKNIGIKTD